MLCSKQSTQRNATCHHTRYDRHDRAVPIGSPNPFRTPVPFWGQSTQKLPSFFFPNCPQKRDYSPKSVSRPALLRQQRLPCSRDHIPRTWYYSSRGPSIVPLARYRACEIAWHIRGLPSVVVSPVIVPVAAIYSAGFAGWRMQQFFLVSFCFNFFYFPAQLAGSFTLSDLLDNP